MSSPERIWSRYLVPCRDCALTFPSRTIEYLSLTVLMVMMLVLTGCGTLIMRRDVIPDPGRFSDERTIYPATLYDGAIIFTFAGFYAYGDCNNGCGWRRALTVIWPLHILDLPVSLVTDTICLPYDIVKIMCPTPKPKCLYTGFLSKESVQRKVTEWPPVQKRGGVFCVDLIDQTGARSKILPVRYPPEMEIPTRADEIIELRGDPCTISLKMRSGMREVEGLELKYWLYPTEPHLDDNDRFPYSLFFGKTLRGQESPKDTNNR